LKLIKNVTPNHRNLSDSVSNLVHVHSMTHLAMMATCGWGTK